MPVVVPVLEGPGIPKGGGVRGPRGERGDQPEAMRHATCLWRDMRLEEGWRHGGKLAADEIGVEGHPEGVLGKESVGGSLG